MTICLKTRHVWLICAAPDRVRYDYPTRNQSTVPEQTYRSPVRAFISDPLYSMPPSVSALSNVQPPRTAITRGERACEECRRMKVRCMREGSDRCHRCQHLNHECVMTPRARRGHGHSNARAKSTRSASPQSREDSSSVARDYQSTITDHKGAAAQSNQQIWPPASAERRASPSRSHNG